MATEWATIGNLGKRKSPEIYGIRVGTLKYIIGIKYYESQRS